MTKLEGQLLHCYRKEGSIYLGTRSTEWAKRFTDIPIIRAKVNRTQFMFMNLSLQCSITTHVYAYVLSALLMALQ